MSAELSIILLLKTFHTLEKQILQISLYCILFSVDTALHRKLLGGPSGSRTLFICRRVIKDWQS